MKGLNVYVVFFIALFMLGYSALCSGSTDGEFQSKVSELRKFAIAGQLIEAIHTGEKLETIVLSSELGIFEKMQYLSTLHKELSVIYFSKKDFDNSISSADKSIYLAKILATADPVFYFDYFYFKKNKADLIKGTKGVVESIAYRKATVSEAINVLKGGDENFLARVVQKHLQRMYSECNAVKDVRCVKFVADKCDFLLEEFRKFINFDLAICNGKTIVKQ